MKIDFIIPYVNCNDPVWFKEFTKYGGVLDSSPTGGINRFKDEGTLKYLLRSIEKYTPWVNNVYLLVASESQIPEYINRDTVKIIYHKDFIPEEYLPIFNSNHLESFMGLLYKIEGLSKHIVWFNDDLLLTKDLPEELFFENEKPCYDIKPDVIHKNWRWDKLRIQASRFILKSNQLYRTRHGTISYDLDLLKDCFEKFDFISTLGKLHSTKRLDCNVSQYAYALYQATVIPIKLPDLKILSVKDSNLNKKDEDWDQMVINSGSLSNHNMVIFTEWMQTKFPNKCKYELNYSNS